MEEIKMKIKNGDAHNNPALIFVLSAILLILGCAVTVLYVVFVLPIIVLVVGLVFVAAGIWLVIFGALRLKKIKAYKSVLENPNAFVTTATFVSARVSSYSSVRVGHIPVKANVYKKITYDYQDEMGITHRVKSTLSYVPNQIAYLREKGTFAIKCKGNVSVIIEELPKMNDMYNL